MGWIGRALISIENDGDFVSRSRAVGEVSEVLEPHVRCRCDAILQGEVDVRMALFVELWQGVDVMSSDSNVKCVP